MRKRKKEKDKIENSNLFEDLFNKLSYSELLSACVDILERYVDQTIVKEIGLTSNDLFNLIIGHHKHFYDIPIKMNLQNEVIQIIVNGLIQNWTVDLKASHRDVLEELGHVLNQGTERPGLDQNQEIEKADQILEVEEENLMTEEAIQEVEKEILKVEVRRVNAQNDHGAIQIVDHRPRTDILQKVDQKSEMNPNNRKIQINQTKKTDLQLENPKAIIIEIESTKASCKWPMLIRHHVEDFLNWVNILSESFRKQKSKFKLISNTWIRHSSIGPYDLWYENLLILDINTKYIWENQELYKCRHTDRAKNQTYPVKFTLVVDETTATSRDAYNDINNWKPAIYKEVFEVRIQPVVKHKIVSWLEAVGCSPEDVQFQGQSQSQWLHPKYIDFNDNVIALKFNDIIVAFAWQCINTPRILSNQSKFLLQKCCIIIVT